MGAARYLYRKNGQSFLEYSILIGVISIAIYYMGTMIKRGMQSVIKVTADQIGTQHNADQDFTSDGGYVDNSRTVMASNVTRQAIEDVNYYHKDTMIESTTTLTNTLTNLGFTTEN